MYLASASFYPQGSEALPSGVASLAGQFGSSVPSGSQSQTPELYVALLKSRVLLREIARDTFQIPEMGPQPVAFLDLFEIEGGTEKSREDDAVDLLTDMVQASLGARNTRIVELSVATERPEVSLAIVAALVNEVNAYNQRTRQGQAGEERRFVEGRLALSGAELRQAEDRLEEFLSGNRQYLSSPELTFEFERLQREVDLRQQVFTSLTQALEDVRIREVRDTPVIVMIDPASVPTLPEPRGRLVFVLLGLTIGGFIGVLTTLLPRTMAQLRKMDESEAREFVGAVEGVKAEFLAPVRWVVSWFRR